jgi:dolichol-phosphate mannosyltransferase
MPLQLWVQAGRLGLQIREVGVPRLYLDPKRAFGGVLNDAEQRLAYYRGVLAAAENDPLPLPTPSVFLGCESWGACL